MNDERFSFFDSGSRGTRASGASCLAILAGRDPTVPASDGDASCCGTAPLSR